MRAPLGGSIVGDEREVAPELDHAVRQSPPDRLSSTNTAPLDHAFETWCDLTRDGCRDMNPGDRSRTRWA